MTTIAPISYNCADLFGNAHPPATPGHGFAAVFSTPESCLAESDYRDIANRAPGAWVGRQPRDRSPASPSGE